VTHLPIAESPWHSIDIERLLMKRDDRERRGGAAHRRLGEGGLKVRILLDGSVEVSR